MLSPAVVMAWLQGDGDSHCQHDNCSVSLVTVGPARSTIGRRRVGEAAMQNMAYYTHVLLKLASDEWFVASPGPVVLNGRSLSNAI